jgi:hypothetical protein
MINGGGDRLTFGDGGFIGWLPAEKFLPIRRRQQIKADSDKGHNQQAQPEESPEAMYEPHGSALSFAGVILDAGRL